MSLTLKNKIKHRALAPELESKDILADNSQHPKTREGLSPLHKKVHSLDEDIEDDSLDEDGDCSQRPWLISSKRQRLEDGTAQIIRHRQERGDILAKHCVSYRLNRHGTGIFTINNQRRMSSDIFSEV
jgi:hypothetical protein